MTTKDKDLRRLAVIADELDAREDLFAERVTIWKRRDAAGDVSRAQLARASRAKRSQVTNALGRSRED